MSNEPEAVTPLDPAELKQRLETYCEAHAVTKFEPDEIIELIEDGEDINWLVAQIAENTEPPAELVHLLADLKSLHHPAEAGAEIEPEPPEPEAELAEIVEPAPETEMPAFDQSMLEGLQLPPGMNLDQLKKLMESPQGNLMADFSQFCQEKGLEADSMDKNTKKMVETLREEWMDTAREAFDGKTPRELMEENPELALPGKVETFRREVPKVGRNDLCPCGSGKKYKKCCGKGL
jgi:uncharacterized protein YecA (UPF0149 family)